MHAIGETLAFLEGGDLARQAYRAGVIAHAEEIARLTARAEFHAAPAHRVIAPTWTVRPLKSARGYSPLVHQALTALRAAGEPRPNGRRVLEEIRATAPQVPDLILSVGLDELKYFTPAGDVRVVGLGQISKVIARLIVRHPPPAAP